MSSDATSAKTTAQTTGNSSVEGGSGGRRRGESAPGGGGLVHRDGHRVLRLLHLRNGRRARPQPGVLPDAQPGQRHPRVLLHLCGGVRRAAARLGDFRPLRRPGGPQVRPGRLAAADGAVHGVRRAAAGLRHMGCLGAAAADRAALSPGHRPGRRVGRGRAARRRARAAQAPWAVCRLPATRSVRRVLRGDRGVLAAVVRARRRGVPLVGLAGAVPAVVPAGRRRTVRTAEDQRDAGLREGDGRPGGQQGPHRSMCCAGIRANCCWARAA